MSGSTSGVAKRVLKRNLLQCSFVLLYSSNLAASGNANYSKVIFSLVKMS